MGEAEAVAMGCGASTPEEQSSPEAKAEPKMDDMGHIQCPILAITTRVCKGGEAKIPELMKCYQTWSDTAYGKLHEGKNQCPGFKTMAFCPAPSPIQDRVIDLQWFNSINGFRGHIDMMNMTLMKATMGCEAYWSKDGSDAYTGYCLGGFDQTAIMGMTIPEMFAWSMFPMPMKAENRQYGAGFMNHKRASSVKPPIIILHEVLVSDVAKYIADFQKAADEAKKDEKVIAFYCSKQCLHHRMLDETKSRNPNKLVNLFAFEELDGFKAHWPKVAELDALVTCGPSGVVWGDQAQETASVKEVIGPAKGEMVKHHSFLHLNEMYVCPPFGEGSQGHSDHTFNCERVDPINKEAIDKGLEEKSCSIM